MSSNEYAIQLNQLSKTYYLYNRPFDRVIQLFRNRGNKLYREVRALNNVSVNIKKGDTVGLIGRNGSGKSTLLEILADTLTPTDGEISVNGKVAALLELGAGFSPEFTGRENVYLNAAIMGISSREIDEYYDDILAFSEIGDFIDQPVKTYSSGMYVRLAFAAAIHMKPEILIVDEALAVGDIGFQRKCYRKFNDLQKQGVTIIFVTHSVDLIRSHCNYAILLERGKLMSVGDPRDVIHEYLTLLFSQHGDEADRDIEAPTNKKFDVESDTLNTNAEVDSCTLRKSYNPTEYRWGDGRAKIIDYLLSVGDKNDVVICSAGDKLKISFMVYFHDDLEKLIYGITIKTVDGITVYGSNTRLRSINTKHRKRGELVRIEFDIDINLVSSDYFVSLGVAIFDETLDNCAIDRRYDLIHFSVEAKETDFGVANMHMQFRELTTVSN